MALATVQDVQDRLGRTFNETETIQVLAWIEDVEAMVMARIPDIEDRVTGHLLNPRVVAAVVSNAVIRKVKNPDGKQNERIDDYSYGLTEDAARGELFLTAEEWALLLPVSTSRGAFSIRPASESRGRGTWVSPSEWVPLP